MGKKFIILFNDELESNIILSDAKYHREITPPAVMGRPIGRAGGGEWCIDFKGELRLYGMSVDFGPYDKKMAQEAFDNKRIYYSDKPAYQEFKITKLKME